MATELHNKSIEDLEALEAKLRNELFRLKVMHFSGQLQKTSELRKTRREIAQVLTVIRERQLSA
jgi:large subunit ribosomal protein L29